jgi:hypothetical protein
MTDQRRLFVVCALGAFGLTLTLAQAADRNRPMIDYRFTPLEQARKLHRIGNDSDRPRDTMTVMNVMLDADLRDFDHMIVPAALATPANLPGQLGGLDGISWRDDGGGYQTGSSACDSTHDCEHRTGEMCSAAGHTGVVSNTVQITMHQDGSKTCSGDCQSGDAVAFVTCGGAAGCSLCD